VKRPSRIRRLGPLRHPAFARLWLAGGLGDRRLAAADRAPGLRPASDRLQPGHLHGLPARAAARPGRRAARRRAGRPLGSAAHAGDGQSRAGRPAAAAAGGPRPPAALDRLRGHRGGGGPRSPLPAGQERAGPCARPRRAAGGRQQPDRADRQPRPAGGRADGRHHPAARRPPGCRALRRRLLPDRGAPAGPRPLPSRYAGARRRSGRRRPRGRRPHGSRAAWPVARRAGADPAGTGGSAARWR
jgi:hypothetical protein